MADQDKDSVKDDTAKTDADKSQPVPIKTDKKDDLPPLTPATETPSPSVPVPPGPNANTGESLITELAADATPSANAPTSAAPAEPIVVANHDLPAQGSDNTEKLAEEIEVLTGEIQALEAKIERLTSNASAVPADGPIAPISADVPPINQQTESATPTAQSDDPKMADQPMTPMPEAPAPGVENDFVNKPKANADMPTANKFDDISPKPPMTPTPTTPEPVKEETSGSTGGGLEVISEVVAVFGLIIFIVLAISPFFRELLGEDTFLAIQQIGWLTALGTLGLGFLLILFTRGKAMFKVLLFLLLLITAVVFLAMNNSSLISPISGTIDPFLDFYR